MTLHVFANIVTPFGTAANNRGETEGNTTTLHKLIWHGEPHTSVSAESIRFALRRRLNEADKSGTNRRWMDEENCNDWRDPTFNNKKAQPEDGFIDDDLLGFMDAKAAQEEGSKGSAKVGRGKLEITRAISLTAWAGDVTHQFASPRAAIRDSKPVDDPAPYTTEVHCTRYQYGLAMTPSRLRNPSRAATALRCLGALGTVAGNQARFLFDFSPESIILRLTDDPAPRLLYCFDAEDEGKSVSVTDGFKNRVGRNGADVGGDELIIGGAFAATDAAEELEKQGAKCFPHQVKAAVEEACRRIEQHADVKGN